MVLFFCGVQMIRLKYLYRDQVIARQRAPRHHIFFIRVNVPCCSRSLRLDVDGVPGDDAYGEAPLVIRPTCDC